MLARLRSTLFPPRIRLRNPEDIDSPCFIVGSGRCGTTLLRRMLIATNAIYIPPETHALADLAKAVKRNRWLTWSDVVYLSLGKLEFAPEFTNSGISLRDLSHDLCNIPKKRKSLATLIDEVFRYHARTLGVEITRWADKTPMYVHHLNTLRQVFPNMQVINLVRDAPDVIVSFVNMDSERSYTVEMAARRWKRAVNDFRKYSRRFPDNCIEVRYEDLVTAPAESCERICRFLDLPFSESMIEDVDQSRMRDLSAYDHHKNTFNAVTTARIGKGRKQLSDSDKQLVDSMIRQEMVDLGYEPLVNS